MRFYRTPIIIVTCAALARATLIPRSEFLERLDARHSALARENAARNETPDAVPKASTTAVHRDNYPRMHTRAFTPIDDESLVSRGEETRDTVVADAGRGNEPRQHPRSFYVLDRALPNHQEASGVPHIDAYDDGYLLRARSVEGEDMVSRDDSYALEERYVVVSEYSPRRNHARSFYIGDGDVSSRRTTPGERHYVESASDSQARAHPRSFRFGDGDFLSRHVIQETPPRGLQARTHPRSFLSSGSSM